MYIWCVFVGLYLVGQTVHSEGGSVLSLFVRTFVSVLYGSS